MTPEERMLLDRTLKLAEENNEILRSMRRSNRISSFLRILYWIIILGVSVGAFYYIQPYVNSLVELAVNIGGLEGVKGVLEQAKDAANTLQNANGGLLPQVTPR